MRAFLLSPPPFLLPAVLRGALLLRRVHGVSFHELRTTPAYEAGECACQRLIVASSVPNGGYNRGWFIRIRIPESPPRAGSGVLGGECWGFARIPPSPPHKTPRPSGRSRFRRGWVRSRARVRLAEHRSAGRPRGGPAAQRRDSWIAPGRDANNPALSATQNAPLAGAFAFFLPVAGFLRAPDNGPVPDPFPAHGTPDRA